MFRLWPVRRRSNIDRCKLLLLRSVRIRSLPTGRASKKRGDDIEEILDSDDEKMLEEEEDEDAAFYHLDPASVAHGFGFDANANGPPPPVPALPHVPGTVPPLQPLLGTANSQTIGH